ncbi:hypothetical protein AB0D04_01960 [Streptomyces sp. NPDC048483]|uniref:hypothetical protein n=1 Tax=Streptomyces sp. NPDC048483 TaxID=3154927 RepID=UPI003447541F
MPQLTAYRSIMDYQGMLPCCTCGGSTPRPNVYGRSGATQTMIGGRGWRQCEDCRTQNPRAELAELLRARLALAPGALAAHLLRAARIDPARLLAPYHHTPGAEPTADPAGRWDHIPTTTLRTATAQDHEDQQQRAARQQHRRIRRTLAPHRTGRHPRHQPALAAEVAARGPVVSDARPAPVARRRVRPAVVHRLRSPPALVLVLIPAASQHSGRSGTSEQRGARRGASSAGAGPWTVCDMITIATTATPMHTSQIISRSRPVT